MIDRLEELLSMIEEEDGDERDKSVVEIGPLSGPGRRTAPDQETPAWPRRPEEEPENSAARKGGPEEEPENSTAPKGGPEGAPEAPAAPEGEQAETVPEELERAVRESAALREERGGDRWAPADGGAETGPSGRAGEEGPRPAAETRTEGEAGRPAAPRGNGDRSGLELLYREIQRAAEPVFQAAESPAEKVLPEPAMAPSDRMTMEELDRAMRRDSRRYDGGMTIY